MNQHGALRDASRPAGILQERNIVCANRWFCETGFAACRERVIEPDRFRERVARHHLLDVTNNAVNQNPFYSAEHVAEACNHDMFNWGFWQRLFEHSSEVLE